MRLREVKGPLDMVYPVGAIYLSTAETSPADLFGGTWERIQDAMLMMGGTKWAPGTTGGSETHTHTTGDVTLTTDQIPSHKHSVGAHAHGLNGHTHTYAKPNTPTGGTAITVAQLASHAHTVYGIKEHSVTSSEHGGHICDAKDANYNRSTTNTGSGSAHSHTIGTTSTNSGGPSTANTAASTAFDSGVAGGGKAHNHGSTGGVFPAAVPGGVRVEADSIARALACAS